MKLPNRGGAQLAFAAEARYLENAAVRTNAKSAGGSLAKGSGKPAKGKIVSRPGGDVAKKSRVIPTGEKKIAFHEKMVAEKKWKPCTGEWKGYFEQKINKHSYRFKQTVEKHEYEVYEKVNGKGVHCGILRSEGNRAGEIIEGLRKVLPRQKKW